MRKLIYLLSFAFLILTLSLMTNDANAQSKKLGETVKTASPVFYFIYEGEEGDGAVELQIHDRQHQFVSMGYDRLSDQAKGNDPKNPLIKLIQIPEIGPLAFRQVESLEEAKLPVDGITVISVRLNKLREAARIIYQ
jgi:hypothetical protein